jgi:dihydrofolate reductase
MRKLIASAWTTLDGIFDADLMQQWYIPFDSESRQNHIRSAILASDAILMGRSTYEMLAPYWSSLKNNEMGIADKINHSIKYVVSSTLKKADWNNSVIIRENIAGEIMRLKDQPGGEIRIEGSAILVRALMEASLIDEYRMLVHPIVMGAGRRYFNEGMHTPGLALVRHQVLDKGVIALHYQPQSLS